MAELHNPFPGDGSGAEKPGPLLTRMFAAGRFALFAMIVFAFLKILGFLTSSISARLHALYLSALFGNAVVVVVAFAATAIMARLDHRAFGYYGLGKSPCGKRFGSGVACGFVALTALLVALRLSGMYFFGKAITHGEALAGYALVYATLFFVVALGEETLFRGYALVSLTEAISFWPAAIVLGIIFGASHSHHGQESYAGLIFAGLYGVVLSYSFLRSGSLWFAIGLHAMWDYAQSFLYGVPDSGVIVPGSWLAPRIHGPIWITGGSAGPEGSYLMIFVLAGIAIAIRRLYPPSRSQT
jgi:uncharacterized protein